MLLRCGLRLQIENAGVHVGDAAGFLQARTVTQGRCTTRRPAADQALDALRLLEGEIRYYIGHTKPIAAMNPERVQRLVEIAKRPTSTRR